MSEKLRVRIPAGAAGEFSSPELTFCADSYSVSVPSPVTPQWHVKDPGHSTKSAGGRLHVNTHTPLAHRSRSGLTMPLSRHSAGAYPETSSHAARQGNIRPQSLQLAELLWTDPGLLKSGISMGELTTSKKKHQKMQAGSKWRNILPKSLQVRKEPPPPPVLLQLNFHLLL